MREAEAKVTRLNAGISDLKQDHAAEIAKLKEKIPPPKSSSYQMSDISRPTALPTTKKRHGGWQLSAERGWFLVPLPRVWDSLGGRRGPTREAVHAPCEQPIFLCSRRGFQATLKSQTFLCSDPLATSANPIVERNLAGAGIARLALKIRTHPGPNSRRHCTPFRLLLCSASFPRWCQGIALSKASAWAAPRPAAHHLAQWVLTPWQR